MSDHATTARELTARALEAAREAGADAAEAVVSTGSSALTRFAGNRIHQNVVEENTGVSVRAVVGMQTGVASTNRTDPDSLRACCRAAVEAAIASPTDPDFPGLPGPRPVAPARPACGATRDFDETARARAVARVVGHSLSCGLTAAGGIKVVDQAVAVANSLGVDVVGELVSLRATVLSMGDADDAGGSGWASFVSPDAAALDADAIGEQAASLALRTRDAAKLAPGAYTVVLAPEAVADIVEFLGWLAFGAKPFAEERSALSGRIGELIANPSVSVVDDAFDASGMGLPFDFEGQPKARVPLIENGIARGVVTDSYWAARTGRENTGHALPAPNGYGPLPLNMVMAGGDATLDELIRRVERGVYVTRFHYVNVEDPIPVTLTGMTRDGTFLIENGRLGRPLRNLRFTQSAIEALAGVRGVTADRSLISSESTPVLVPGLLIEDFHFTGQTE